MADEQAMPDAEPDRQAQPVDAEQPPRLPFPVVGIGASAGGIEAAGEFLEAMRPDSGMAFVLIQHLPPDHKSMMADILGRRTQMPVRQVEDGLPVEPDHVYVIRPGHVLTIRDGRLHLGPRLGTPRAANRPIDDFFKSLAEEQRERAIAVILTGMGSNGTAGAQAVKAVGGLCVAQDPETAEFPSMPRHLIEAGYADYIARPADLPDVLLTYAGSPYARGGREADAEEALRREERHLREILALLRTRTRHDFSGYKKPTLLRRIQRRTGLARAGTIAEYARLLRQTPAEARALADDLLIHVTGFFRDADAWEALRQHVVAPLVEAREPGGVVRAWVTACSSGEEAYSLAMLLAEEAARADKPLDIKVFATDLAERALDNARAGIYPGGIESEIPPERLERFFVREDEAYRVRPELRDRVVFASQNVLQDPPFSRLDIATCRNLLIYLEPEVQQRVLSLLHFGLREGGALFLGSAETVAGADDLFEPVDKKARIYRRVGPTRHGSVEFPLPHAIPRPTPPGDNGPDARAPAPFPALRRGAGARPPVEQLTHGELLEHHTPVAITVDRDGRVLYYHGDTRPYLKQLSGEPTRDVMMLAQDGLRGAVRAALHRAAAENARATEGGGWIDVEGGRRVRVVVTASPVPADAGAQPGWFVVSFADRGDLVPPGPAEAGDPGPDETRRLRAELRRTIEELQASNEELKASNEEVMSINEELQSANEELETSKEEMQSLNEELTTVNAQLRAKADEYQAASSDLASLLASTDIAVLFLDPALLIRRFTPAVRDLVDLIAPDVGRPLSALARKFDDPTLDDDCRAVLDRLTPVEREVPAASGRHYLRRVTAYRTTDNRIDGVVVTFVDITARRRAEAALREGEERLRLILESATDFAILTQAPDRTVTGWSPGAEAVFGYAADEIVGSSVDRLFTPEDRAAGAPASEAEAARRDGRAADERWHLRKDGTRFYGSGSLSPLGSADRGFVKVLRDLTDRKRMEDELRAARDDLERRVEERAGELRASQDRALRAERLAAIGQTVTTLAHEGRNALQRAVGCLEMLRWKVESQADATDLVGRTRRALDDLNRLFDDVRAYAAPIHLTLGAVDVGRLWRNAWARVAEEHPDRDARLDEEPGDADLGCQADPFRLAQVFQNLFDNALEACPDPVRVTVAGAGATLNGRPAVRVSVADNGPGFAGGDSRKALEPFFTTKPKGTGLGLAIVKRLVEAHGGTVEIAEPNGGGAVVTLTLPRAQG